MSGRRKLGALFVGWLTVVLAVGLGSSTARSADTKGEGTQRRAWVSGPGTPPASMSQATYAFTTQPARVPTRDGTMLPGLLYLPVRAPGEAAGPCVLWAEGYSPPSAVGAATFGLGGATFQNLARRGYAGAHIDLRGLGTPDGEGLYYKYAEDGRDIVEWMAEQPWCNGNVGMIGASLDGITQWLAAATLPPHLKAIVPQIGCGDCYWHLWYKGGTLPGSGREGRTPPVTATDEYGAAMQHRTYDKWWKTRNTDTSEHRAMARAGIAAMQCGGWDDYIFAGGLRAIEEMEAAGGNGYQIVGPCAHGGETVELVPYDLDTFTVLWFDRFLKGIRNGIDKGPEALIWVRGANQYRFEKEWPIPDTTKARLYLRAEKSRSARSLNDGSLKAAAASGRARSVSYNYSPDGPLNDAGGAGAKPTNDQRPEEAFSLTWTTEPVRTPTEITGWPRFRFFASSTARDTDFVMELTDVSPDGTSTQITRGWLNAPQAFSRTSPKPLRPGKIYQFDAELRVLSYVVQPGHRIRLSLQGSDSPGTAPNPNAAKVTVYQDGTHRSYLELPIVGTSHRKLLGKR